MRQKQWNDEFKGQLHISYGTSNSRGVLTEFYGNINVVIKKQLNDKIGTILILEVTINGAEYLLINICNGNREQDQLETLQNLSNLLENFDNIYRVFRGRGPKGSLLDNYHFLQTRSVP